MSGTFSFISDDSLTATVASLIKKAREAALNADDALESNTLDPFSALFESLINNQTLDEWEAAEKSRQVQKSIQNAIGEFHQTLLGSFEGWINPGAGGSFDLEDPGRKIIAEVKNKHNTMNSSSALATYSRLSDHLKYDKKGYTAYLVQIVPAAAEDYNKPWSPNLSTQKLREDIRKIDGESFYDLASGEKNTLKRIYEHLPQEVARLLKIKVSAEQVNDLNTLFRKVYR